MNTKRYNTYGPPNHRPNNFLLDIEERDGDIEIAISAYAPTHKGRLYRLTLEAGIDPEDPHAHLILGQVCTTILEDLWRDRPNSEARGYFVLGGGLYEQQTFGWDNE